MKRLLLTPLIVLFLAADLWAAPTLGGPLAPDGKTKVTIDLPAAMRAMNTGGTDGSGLCVFTSIMHAARWQKESPLEDFQTLMQKERGGGWPAKVDQMIAKYASGTDYFQYQGIDSLVIKAALAGGRLPSITYNGRDPHYKGWISHMVNCVHYDDRWVAILDNNYIGENDIVWMTPADFQERWRGKGSGWVVILLKEPPATIATPIIEKRLPKIDGGNTKPVVYTWYYHKADPWRVYLYCDPDEYLVGAYDLKGGYFRYYAGDEEKWLSKTTPPFPVPKTFRCDKSGPVGTAEDYGIPLDMFPPRGPKEERWTRKGQPATKAELLKLLEPKPKPVPIPIPVPVPNPQPAGPDTTPFGSAALVGLLMLLITFLKK
jgi:hypothetical protein